MTLRAPAAFGFLGGGYSPEISSYHERRNNPTRARLRLARVARYARVTIYATPPPLFGEIGVRSGLRPHLRIF